MTPTASTLKRSALALAAVAAGLLSFASCTTKEAKGSDEKVLNMPIRSAGPGSLDPVRGSTTYDNQACSLVYETLLQYKYLKRPFELEPLLLEEMPTVEGNVYSFKLKEGVLFADNDCFPGGKGRELTTDDVFYSWLRLADSSIDTKNWWLLKDTIKGLDEYRDAQNAAIEAGGAFDYSGSIAGLRKIDDHRFEVELNDQVPRFMWVLAMFQTSIVPREAVQKYGTGFSRKPVGSGPFLLESWVTSSRMSFVRNPNFRPEYYPTEWMPEDEVRGLGEMAGAQIPFVDRIEIPFFIKDNPMWLKFRAGDLDYIQVPVDNYEEAIDKRTRKLRQEFVEEGITYAPVPLLDFIFRGFNMEHEILGGYDESSRKLRQAMSLAVDLGEFNDAFYSSVNIVYDGPIPPGLDGYPKDGVAEAAYRGPDLVRARQLLAEAGYPGGDGLPAFNYYTSQASTGQEQSEMMKRHLGEIGIELNSILLEFPQLIETINNKKAPMFSFAWSSDYPDGENNLALFYGPNESPGSNHFNYKNAEYDRLYEKILTMEPGPERTKIYAQMRDMLLEDVPYIGSMARTRHYLITSRLKNFKPTEQFYTWPKYLDVASADPARP